MTKKDSVNKTVKKTSKKDISTKQNKTLDIPKDDANIRTKVSLYIMVLINKMKRLCLRVGSSAKSVLLSLIKTLKRIVKFITNPFVEGSERIKLCKKKYIKAKALGKKETIKAVTDNVKCMTNHVLLSTVHYCVPILSAGFLIASIRYTASLEYGIDATYSSEEMSSVTQLQNEEIDSIGSLEKNKEVTVFPKFSFKSIEDSEETLGDIIDNIKEEEQSNKNEQEGMSEGFGIFLEDEFLGAVLDKSKVEETLNNILNEYLEMDNVTEAHFTKKIVYNQGLYLTEYMVSPEAMCETITGNAKEDIFYTIEDGDTFTLISEITGLSIDELLELNPQITNPNVCRAGDELLIQKSEPFLQVEYTKSIVTKTEIPYESITQDDDTLPLGKTEVITEGEMGIQTDITEIKYLNDEEISVTNLDTELTKEPITQVIAVGTGLNVQEDDISMATYNGYNDIPILGVGQFIWPVDGGYISDPFISDRNHKGLDIAAPSGTSIYAGASGTVVSAGWNAGGYGYFVMLDHGNGYATLYGHMSKVIAVAGQQVNTGDIIGLVGSTGDSSGNHLHFEVRYNNVCQNPQDYIVYATSE
ncbi:MAG: peptidoglycan DD-metalloendopeptidase family protein [Ruminococcus sp.]|nr:peptidoglycan DD-metalloendopeptidase family protein [Ruminococcus sp.]